jgi:transposase
MAQTVSVIVGSEDRARLAAIIGDRNRPLKHTQRANIILLSAKRLLVLEVARCAGVSRPAVWRWQRRYAEQGIDGLLRDKTRKPGRAPLATAMVAKVLALTCAEPPGAVTHWTGRAMAKRVGISLSAVQRIWQANRLQPHRLRTFKRSNDPAFASKVEDIVGLYMDPPCHAVVLSIDEKSQIQALDRTQPGLPLKPGKCGTMTHDYKRNGTTTLFAALNTLDGTVLGRCMTRHTHQEFVRFLNAVERAVPAGKVIHAILDNYATHKHPKVQQWLADHPRWVFHFTPTSASWINAVEGFFSAITRRRIRRGVFKSVPDLQDAITRYIRDHNKAARPFAWAKPAENILGKLARLPAPSV